MLRRNIEESKTEKAKEITAEMRFPGDRRAGVKRTKSNDREQIEGDERRRCYLNAPVGE